MAPWIRRLLLVTCAVAALVPPAARPVRGADAGADVAGGPEPREAAAVADEAEPVDPRAAPARIPPVPDGTPAELMRYIEQISDPAALPRSMGRKRYYLKKAAAAFVEVADKILSQVAATDPMHAEAVRLKFDGYALLDSVGAPAPAAERAAFARRFIDSPVPTIARAARGMVLEADIDAMPSADLAAGEALVARAVAILEADPRDATAAKLVFRLAGALEDAPGGERLARRAYEACAAALAGSDDRASRGMARRAAGAVRRLGLLGRPLAIEGVLLDGGRFDAAALRGKVVLVDFWATWCGPCVAEIPNIREQYEKYHDRGFEVVGISLDDDHAAATAFVADKQIPWPVIIDGRGPNDSLADRYGIEAIPALFLVGRDGTVISLRARGEALAALLAEQFPAARP